MKILCVGISHKTASVVLRERLVLDDESVVEWLEDMGGRWGEMQGAILSTCNRTEVYVVVPRNEGVGVEGVVEYLAEGFGVGMDELGCAVYHQEDHGAIEHLMRVAAGLESMVLGEGQIMGQVRRAYELAQEAGVADKALHQLFQSVLAMAKRVRTETGIGKGKTSVSSVAVDFAKHLFTTLEDKTVLVIGAGKMAELTLTHFMELTPQRLVVCNRSVEKASELAEKYGGEAGEFGRLMDHVVEADVVITSTGSKDPVLTTNGVGPLIKRRRFRPLFLIDIALPRDVEGAVGSLANVYLYDLDDLNGVLVDQQTARNGQVGACEAIIGPGVGACYAAVQTGDFSSVIRQLRDQLQAIGLDENKRTLNKLQTASEEELEKILDQHTHRLLNKILHRPLSELTHGSGRSEQAAVLADALRQLFHLDEGEG